MTFILEVIVSSAILFAGYLMLKRRTPSHLLRVYLLGSLVVSLVFPAIHIDVPPISSGYAVPANVSSMARQVPIQNFVEKPELTTPAIKSVEVETPSFTWSGYHVVGVIYLLVSTMLLVRLVMGIVTIFRLRNRSTVIEQEGLRYYEVEKNNFVGATFFRWIFVGQVQDPAEFSTVLEHEVVHSQRLHSVDIMLAELYCAVLWFNPVAWLLRKEIKLNVEFETDQHFISNGRSETYSGLLIRLATGSAPMKTATAFSATALKKRIHRMKTDLTWGRTRFTLFSLFFVLVSFVLVSCRDQVMNELISLRNSGQVKTITTRFVSHQPDTHEKDNKIVAIAHYDSTGYLASFTQHMTYPYNLTESYTREFWDEPDPEGVMLIMDGLHLDQAETNFLYGNQWPIQYARTVDPRSNDYSLSVRKRVLKMQGEFPLELEVISDNGFVRSPSIERFEYENNKVISYQSERNVYIMVSDEYKDKVKEGLSSYLLHDAKFQYAGEHLTEVYGKRGVYRFKYDVDRIVRSEYYLNEKMYNYREYFYDEAGKKIRTEIFNVDGQPEYTIFYDYMYY